MFKKQSFPWSNGQIVTRCDKAEKSQQGINKVKKAGQF